MRALAGLALARRERRQARALIVGEGVEAGRLRGLADRLGVPATFAGFLNQTEISRAYVAAVLNGFAGASDTDAVEGAMEFAEAFFAAYTPASARAMTKAERASVIAMAGLLDDYNNGITGPGHCEE